MCTLPNNSTCYSNTWRKNGFSVCRKRLKNMKTKLSTERTKHRVVYSWQWQKPAFIIILGKKTQYLKKNPNSQKNPGTKGPVLQNRKKQLNATHISLNICGGFLIHLYNLLCYSLPYTSKKKDSTKDIAQWLMGSKKVQQGCRVAQHQLCLCTEMQMWVVVVGYSGKTEIGGSRCCNLMMMLFLLSLKNHFKS